MKKNENYPQFNLIDNVLRYVAPASALRRAQARMALSYMDKARRFDGASRSPRMSGWKRPGTSADAALTLALPVLRNGSRDLTRNNPWADKALSVIENNTVGTGILGQITHPNKDVQDQLESLWADWAMSNALDADDRLDLVALEGLIIRTIAESGEVIIRRRYRRARDKYPIPVQIQVMEPDHLDSSKDSDLGNGGKISNGIEYDKRNKRVAYWLFTEHPGEVRTFRNNYQSIRIPARDIIHAFDPKRSGQNRGYPWVASAIRRLKDFDDYEDAQLVRQKIAACFTGFIHDMSHTDGPGATGLPSPEDKDKGTETDLEYLQPGVFERLPPGKDIKFPSPPGVQNYGEYSSNILRGAAAGYGITYEAMTGDYSGVNFSSGRMGWIEMSRNVHRWQNAILRVQVLDRLARWFFGGATLRGFNTEGAKIKWMPPRREMIDPTKEVPAMIKALRGGLSSLPRVMASMGYDYDEVIEEIKKSNERLDKENIILDSDPRRVNAQGTVNTVSGDDPPEIKDDDS